MFNRIFSLLVNQATLFSLTVSAEFRRISHWCFRVRLELFIWSTGHRGQLALLRSFRTRIIASPVVRAREGWQVFDLIVILEAVNFCRISARSWWCNKRWLCHFRRSFAIGSRSGVYRVVSRHVIVHCRYTSCCFFHCSFKVAVWDNEAESRDISDENCKKKIKNLTGLCLAARVCMKC